MITARVKNGRFYVDDPTDEVMDIIRTEYSIIDPKSRMIRSEYPVEPVRFYRTRKCGDNNLRVLHVSQMMGLAERTISIFKRHGISLVIPKPEHSPIRFRSACTGATLDPIQLEVVHALLKVRRGVSELSVGSGKTIVMAELAGSFFLETGLPSVIVVPKKQLLHQSYAELQRFLPGIKIGMIGDSKRIPGDICIATAQTLTSAMLDEETAKWMGARKGQNSL